MTTLICAAGIISYLAFLPPSGFLIEVSTESSFGLFNSFMVEKGFSIANILNALLYFFVLVILILIAFIDSKTQEIPNLLNGLLLCGAVLSIFLNLSVSPLSHFVGLFLISVPLFLITLVLPDAFGMGDVKLMGAGGLLLGWEHLLVAAIVGLLIGGVQGTFFLLTKSKGRKDHFAFGPALCIGIATGLFAGHVLFENWFLVA